MVYYVYMHISYFTHYGGLSKSTGFGYAGFNIVTSLQALGHKVTFNDPTAEVQLMFTQPPAFQDFNGLNIGYTPWESTKVPDEWLPGFAHCNQFWATSHLNKEWYESQGITVNKVYPHGINHDWTPKHRKRRRKFRILHIGGPAPRKSGQLVLNTFIKLFEDNDNVILTIKSDGPTDMRYDPNIPGVLHRPDYFPNVNVIERVLDDDELISLFHQHDLLIYPSYGEGFGFIPLQALATGMPVIFNTTWAEYKEFSVGLDLRDRLVKSPWPHMHPGQMLEPNKDDLEKQMLEAYYNYQKYADKAFEQAPELHEKFDWVNVTEAAFDGII